MKTLRRDREDGLEGELPHLEVEPLPEGEARLQRLKEMVAKHAFATFAYDNPDGCLVLDVQTANVMVQVAEVLRPANREKYLSMDLGEMVDLTWKLVA
jgi:hypothetical protein